MRYVKRSWGWYFILLDREHFKVKLLRFKAGNQLSHQYHSHRSELWVFLKGGGWFIHDDEITLKVSGDYSLANFKEVHSFKAAKTTYAIEVQFGEKCVEEDIVRL